MTQIPTSLKFFCFLVCLASIPSLKALPAGYQNLPPEPISNFSFYEDISPQLKDPFNLEPFLRKDKVVILHFWSTSCPACITELPQIDKAAQTYKNQPIEFLVISLNDPQGGYLTKFFGKKRIRFLKPYKSPSLEKPAIYGLPTTLIINRTGLLVGKIEGPAAWQSSEMDQLLTRLMNRETLNPVKKS